MRLMMNILCETVGEMRAVRTIVIRFAFCFDFDSHAVKKVKL